MKDKFATALFIIALILFILTFSISIPIYCRFLYYIQIKTLNLESLTGWSYDVIKTAYDDVLDFCTLPWVTEFKAGQLKFSESGAAHFYDCKLLFNLNAGVLLASLEILITLPVMQKLKLIKLLPLKGHGPQFYAAVTAIALPVILGVIIAVDFQSAFNVFHSLFFPGKDNWIFNPVTDEIILVMPQQFFMNCVIEIGVTLTAFASALIIFDYIAKIKRERNKKRI